MAKSNIPLSVLPWFGVFLVGASVHATWLVYELARDPPSVQVVMAPVSTHTESCPNAQEPTQTHVATAAIPDVDCMTSDQCTIERPQLKHMLAHGRVVPALAQGQVVGFKVYGLRKHSLLRRLGFKNGDLISGINGQPTAQLDPPLLQSLAAIPDATTLNIEFERKGEQRTKQIKIR